jgi:hypothetical protein
VQIKQQNKWRIEKMENKKKEFCIVSGRCGTYAGYLEEEKGNEVEMSKAFCLFRWSGAGSLNQLAQEGVKKPDDCKFSMEIPRIRLKEVLQILPCSDAAKENLLKVKKWML